MPYVNLPPGNRGFTMQSDGTHYRAAREGGRVWVEEHHVADINGMGGNGDAGLLNALFREYGIADGRRCACGFANYFWPCSRCGRTGPSGSVADGADENGTAPVATGTALAASG